LTKLVVTGATGHLGQYVVDRFARAGVEVVAISRGGQSPGRPFGANIAARPLPIRPLAADLTADAAIDLVAAELGPGAGLVHLAAWHPPATAETSAADRRALIETNVVGTQRVLDAVRIAGGAEIVVFASTFEVYGPPATTPIGEDSPLSPHNDYGVTKLSGEDHLFAFAAEERIRALALRLPAIYGPGETVARALPNFLRAVVRGARPVIYGDGSDRRDQIHAADAALAIERAVATGDTGAYNVSDGLPHTIRDLALTAMEVAGMPGDPESRPRQKPRVDFHMNIEKARRILGFEPAVVLETGMAEQLRWLRQAALTTA
jgi:nucleoside-diphosphate-sugar epimerase